jgi:hypothetical protein
MGYLLLPGQVLGRVGTIFVQPGLARQGLRVIDFHLNKHDISSSMYILPVRARTPMGKSIVSGAAIVPGGTG